MELAPRRWLPGPASHSQCHRPRNRAWSLVLMASFVFLGSASCIGQEKPTVGFQMWEGLDPTVRYRYSARYPQLMKLRDETVRHRINDRMKNLATGMVERSELRNHPVPDSYTKVTSEVALADHGLVSVAYFREDGSAGSAHPALAVETLNLELSSGNRLSLSALFLPDSNYLEIIARETMKQLGPKLGPSLDMFEEELAPRVKNYRTFTLNPTGLDIYFGGCRLSCAGANARVLVPYSALKGLIIEDGPLGWAGN